MPDRPAQPDTQSRVTLRDVSKAAGVAVSTASAILGNKSHCYASEAVRQRVFETARKLNYRPNQLARGLRSQKSSLIGMIFESLKGPSVTMAKVAGIERRAWELNYKVLVGNHHGDYRREREYIDEFVSNQVDGLIMHGPFNRNMQAVLDLARHGTPLVTIDSVYEQPTPNVTVNREIGAYWQVMHLLKDAGCKRLALMTPMALGPSVGKVRGIERALEELGSSVNEHIVVEVPTRLRYSDPIAKGIALCEQLLASTESFDAILSPSDSIAFGAMSVLLRRGIRIPDDVAIIGYDDEDYAQHLPIPLTTIRQPRDAGIRALDLLMEQIGGNWSSRDQSPQLVLEPELVVRESTLPSAGQNARGKNGKSKRSQTSG